MHGRALLTGALMAITAATAHQADAAEVRLTSIDTGFVLTGELVRFELGDYVIRSSIGQLTVRGDQVRCEGEACPKTNVFQSSIGVFGSDMIGSRLMPGLIESYSETLNSTVEREIGADASRVVMRLRREGDGRELAAIDLRSDSSANAFPGLISGAAAIGMSSRPVTETEIAAMADAGYSEVDKSGTEHVLALDGLIVIVARDNPVRSLSAIDLTPVFTGEIDNWADLGGPDAPINLYMREPGSGAYDTFESLVLAPTGARIAPSARFFRSARALSDAVAADPNGIGVTGMAFERNARALSIETECGLVIEPSEFNVKTEEYPLSRRLFLYTTGAPIPPSASGLLDYALSDDAQGQIADLGFINHDIEAISLNDQGRRIAEAFILPRDPESLRTMRELALELLDGQRLSTTMRFRRNSSVLDVKSRTDIGRLARFIANGGADQKELLLIGFADDTDRLAANLSLSSQRAAQIKAELDAELARIGAAGRTDVLTLGYGDLAPVGCGDDSFGGVSNRRVEVWLRERF